MLTDVNTINPDILFSIDESEMLKCEYSSDTNRIRFYHPYDDYDVVWAVSFHNGTRYYDRIGYRAGFPVSHLVWEY